MPEPRPGTEHYPELQRLAHAADRGVPPTALLTYQGLNLLHTKRKKAQAPDKVSKGLRLLYKAFLRFKEFYG